ncbi:hypothetical protein ACIBEJ_00415 [Nonomuraea sp. NPDC050790]|uniref:hypothetical protein n=1 Tax=Nonomuraea sp. NPDC050790 TaxID=3364371 RepID=UPI003788D12E
MTTLFDRPDCGRCHDTGRYAWTGTPRIDITPELLHQMSAVFIDHQDGPTTEAAIRAGLASVLDQVLKPVTVEHLCTCKHGLLVAGDHSAEHQLPETTQIDSGRLAQLLAVARELYCVHESLNFPEGTPYSAQRQATYQERADHLLALVAPELRDQVAIVWRQEQARRADAAAGVGG